MDYQITERLLKNDTMTKKIPVLEFENERDAILSEFIMADGMLLMEQILADMAILERGERQVIKASGNRCGIVMEAEQVLIYDLFEDLPGVNALPSVKLEPEQLKSLLLMWESVLSSYN